MEGDLVHLQLYYQQGTTSNQRISVNLKCKKEFMCIEIRISVEVKENRLEFSFIVSVHNSEKKSNIMDEKWILLPQKKVIIKSIFN